MKYHEMTNEQKLDALSRIVALLAAHGCDCDCDCDRDGHLDTCDVCFPCQVGAAINRDTHADNNWKATVRLPRWHGIDGKTVYNALKNGKVTPVTRKVWRSLPPYMP